MAKIEITEEKLPLGAAPQYTMPDNGVAAFLTPSKQFKTVGPGVDQILVPLLRNLTTAELNRFKMEITKILPGTTEMKVIQGNDGWGLCCFAVDASYVKPKVPSWDDTPEADTSRKIASWLRGHLDLSDVSIADAVHAGQWRFPDAAKPAPKPATKKPAPKAPVQVPPSVKSDS